MGVWNLFFGMVRFCADIEYRLIGGELFLTGIRSKTKHLFTNFFYHNLYYAGFAVAVYSLFMFIAGGANDGNASALSAIFMVLIILSSHWTLIYDFDVFAAFFKNYKQSSYHLATGVTKKELYRDAGLQGEFKAYVLSRQLDIPHRILYNVCVPMKNGNFQEVDAVIITENLVYAIECKNRGTGGKRNRPPRRSRTC